MPIPKPKAGEPKNAYISRCMGDDKMREEYPKQDQLAAVCNTTWRETKMAAEDNETYSFDAEILAEGKWNNTDISRQTMDQMVTNFRTFADILDVPLKFGHNDEQKMTDGQPALGWISDLWIDKAGKMMARLTDMPKIVYEAVKAKRYKNVSIEASLDVSHKGKEYGAVLTGLALLGADIPAVNTLNDLQTYMTAQNDLQFSQCANFSAIGGTLSTNKGGHDMPFSQEELDAAVAKAKQDSETKFAAAEARAKAAEAEAEELKAADKQAKFAAQKQSVEADMETLVKANKLTPGMRDQFAAQIKDEATLASVQMSVNILKGGVDNKGMDTGEQGKETTSDDKEHEGMRADEILHAKAVKYSKEKDISYNDAVDIIMLNDTKLAREYTDQFDQEG